MPKISEVAFIHVDGISGKPKATCDKLLVRSHCMRGRNKQEGSRRSIRKARQQHSIASPKASLGNDTATKSDAPIRYTTWLSPFHASPLDFSLVTIAGNVNRNSQQLLFKRKDLICSYSLLLLVLPVLTCLIQMQF